MHSVVWRTNTIRTLLLALAITFASSPLSSAPCSGPVCLLGEFYDDFQDEVPVGGVATIRGVMQATTPIDELKLQGLVPASWSGKEFCGRVVTADGLYLARNTYRVSDEWSATATVNIPFMPSDRARLMSYEVDTVAASISLGRCGLDGEVFALAFWNRDQLATEEVIVIKVNSQDRDQVKVFTGIEAQFPITCNRMEKRYPTFDFRCELPLHTLELDDDGLVQIDIVYIRGRKFDHDSIVIELGPK